MRGQNRGTRGQRSRRRGLSSVVGAVFLIIVMVVALNAMMLTMREQERVSMAVTGEAGTTANRLNERIEISNIRVESNNKMNMTVSNAGGQAAVLKALYVVDETASPKQQYRYDLNSVVDGSKPLKNIGQDLPFTASPSSSYSVRVVTASGNAASATFVPPSALGLPMALYVIPPTPTPGAEVTILYAVSNNSTDGYLASGVTPVISTDCGGCVTQQGSSPGKAVIAKGATALFKWAFRVNAGIGTTIMFNASLAEAKQGNYVLEKAKVEPASVASSTTTQYSETVIVSTLVQKPEIFTVLPSPFGDSNQEGLIGVVIANPTEGTMEVSRVVINLYSSKPASNFKMIQPTSTTTPVDPSSGWTILHDNTVEWKNVLSPVMINSRESKAFLLKIQPGDLPGGDSEPAFTVAIAVFTNMGQFTKTGYASSMSSSGLSLGNVYLTDTNSTSLALDKFHIFGTKNGVTKGSSVTLHVAVADFDTSASTYIKNGTRLIVNVPRNFTVNSFDSYSGFYTPIKIPYSDKSTQIVAIFNGDLGDTSAPEAKVLKFTVTAPTDITEKKVYIMYTLLDGETSTNFSAGALAEIAIGVTP